MDKKDLTRRDFVKTGFTTGFALAVQPISAWAIATDAKGLEDGNIEIPVGSEKIPAYWGFPKGKKGLPLVLVIHEIFGVHEHIKDVCRRLAKEGFLAIAPNLFSREGDVTQLKEIADIWPIVNKVPLKQVLGDMDAAVAFAKKSGHFDGKRLSATGFCWGGRAVWLYAAHNPSMKAGAAWYGTLVGTTPQFPQCPVDIAPSLKVPVLGLYGGKDDHITLDHVKQMEAALKKSPSHSEIRVYPNSGHAFFADYRPSYNKTDADDAYPRMLAWFKKHGAY